MPFVTSKITESQAQQLRDSIGKYANFPPNPDRPMMVVRIDPLSEPEGDKTYGLYAELGEDVAGMWFINGMPIRLTRARLSQTQRLVGDRLAAFIRHLAGKMGDEPLNLDSPFQRAEIRDRARAVIKTALMEDGYTFVRDIRVQFIKTSDGGDSGVPEITLAMQAMVTYRGVDLEVSGPQSQAGSPSLFPEDK